MKCQAFYLVSIEAIIYRTHKIREQQIKLYNIAVLENTKIEIEAMFSEV